MYVCMYKHMVCMCNYMSVCAPYVHTFVYICVCMCMCMCMYVCVCVCVCMYVYVYVYVIGAVHHSLSLPTNSSEVTSTPVGKGM